MKNSLGQSTTRTTSDPYGHLFPHRAPRWPTLDATFRTASETHRGPGTDQVDDHAPSKCRVHRADLRSFLKPESKPTPSTRSKDSPTRKPLRRDLRQRHGPEPPQPRTGPRLHHMNHGHSHTVRAASAISAGLHRVAVSRVRVQHRFTVMRRTAMSGVRTRTRTGIIRGWRAGNRRKSSKSCFVEWKRAMTPSSTNLSPRTW